MKSFLPPKKFKILLIGDTGLDVYQFGNVRRISPEAPVPVFDFLYSEERPGMASNVKANLEALGVEVDLLTSKRSVKTRLIDLKTKHHIVRIDNDNPTKEPLVLDRNYISWGKYDAVVVSDYNKGFISYDTLFELKNIFNGPVYVDTKKTDLSRLEGFFVKINEDERNKAVSLCSEVIVTMGGSGAVYKDKSYPGQNVEVSDACGAGDTFLAALAYFHLLTGNMDRAITYANKAAAVTVQHLGTYAPKLEEFI